MAKSTYCNFPKHRFDEPILGKPMEWQFPLEKAGEVPRNRDMAFTEAE